jgi:hypothetical protein
MNKRVIIAFTALIISTGLFAQTTTTPDITKKNSWLKIGLNAGVPVGNISDFSSFVAGLELKGQLMETNHVGIGLTTGYNHFFAKNNGQSFGTVPLGAFIRVYPESKGFFAGLDAGYSFVTGVTGAKGGAYVKPQLGYHNYDWNVFGFYNHIFRSDANGGSIPHVGIGATYNIRFN